MKKILLLLSFIFIFSCKKSAEKSIGKLPEGRRVPIEYAEGFEITDYGNFKILEVKNPFPKAEKSFRYLLAEENAEVPEDLQFDQKVQIPIEKIVVTSTTHIPSLETLEETKTLIGFPGLDYISSEKTRKRIDAGKLRELGKNEAINTEVLLALQPDVVVGFAVDSNNKTFNTIQKSGIPVVYNADWVEDSPLGKAEWIKFFGAFYNKTDEAAKAFNEVKKQYFETKRLATTAETSPSVLSGSMYKDIWYAPYGNSWQAQFIKDANANYVYANKQGDGSLSLSIESVLNEAKNAEFWIGPAQFTSYEQMLESSKHYAEFKAFQKRKVFTYSSKKGKTGGVIYYELAPNRPDLVLKDLVSIFHPELLPEHELVFFEAVK